MACPREPPTARLRNMSILHRRANLEKVFVTCINLATVSCASRLLQAQPHASTAQRDPDRRRTIAGCSCAGCSIHQPAGILEPSGVGRSRRHRRGRVAPANSFAPGSSSFRGPIFIGSGLTLDQSARGRLRCRNRIRRRSSLGRNADDDGRASRRRIFCS
jgi:hypothetical protein